MAESNNAQSADENGIKVAQPSDIVLDLNESKTKDVRIVNGSVHYTGEEIAANGEVSGSSGKEVQQNSNGIEGNMNGHQNGDSKSPVGNEEIVKLAPAESTWTVQAEGAVKLLMGSTGSRSCTPLTVVQCVERAVRHAPTRTALAVKRNGEWLKWTYAEYYESIRAAAKSFIKVREILPFIAVEFIT